MHMYFEDSANGIETCGLLYSDMLSYVGILGLFMRDMFYIFKE